MSFRDKVYEILRTIPPGKVVTYGQLAAMAGRPNAARAVGMFMKNNPDAPRTPCHRVVAADGSMHGYSGQGGIETKRKMLASEGVAMKNGKAIVEKTKKII